MIEWTTWPTPREQVVRTMDLVERLCLVERFSERVVKGALRDAGPAEEGYASFEDFLVAVESFAARRAAHGRRLVQPK